MTIVKWKPQNRLVYNTMGDILNEMNKDHLGFASSSDYEWSPPVDITESNSNYNIIMDIPGLSKKDIKINISDNFLNISGKRENKLSTKDKCYNYSERESGSFKRSFNINDLVDENKIIANFTDGLLNIKLPKLKKETLKEKNIKIN